ncbi:MAG: ATP-dependent nuclease [Chloroflexota bacterium]
MRVSQVDIDKFLCFKHLTLPVDRSLQMLAGPNNAGKSSFIRLVEAFFANPDSNALVALLPRNDYYAEAGSRTMSEVKIWFDHLSEEEVKVVGGALRRDGRFWIALRCTRSGSRSFEASKASAEDAKRLYDYVLENYQLVKIPSVRVGGAGDLEKLASLERLLDTMESVLIRRTAGNPSAVQKAFATKIEDVEKVVKEALDESAKSIGEDLPFQDGSVTFSLPEPRFALRGMLQAAAIESLDGTRVPVADRGTGFQSALVLGMLRYVAEREGQNAGNVLFAIEEPEAFLHPQTQRAMTQVLRGIASDAQVLVTTHSPVVVDTFKLGQIARLPLEPSGTDYHWRPPKLDDAQEGRLTRYCSAANSELVFANAVILVEGESDYLVVEYLLGRICGGPGGHYARGLTVIEAGGIGRIKRLVELAEHFGVRAFTLVDKDGLRAASDRKLLDILAGRKVVPGDTQKDAMRSAADTPSPDYAGALVNQAAINQLLAPFDAYMMVSDLEGMLLDSLGVQRLIELLGPDGAGELDQQFIEQELVGQTDAKRKLARRIGSKGWDASLAPTGKVEPHLPKLVLEQGLAQTQNSPEEIARLEGWLREIVDGITTAAV